MLILNKFFIIILVLLLTNCGFKIVNQSENINFNIANISTLGDNRIGYRIKNKLLPFSKNYEKESIFLEMEIKKNKTIREKSKSNEATKYQINIEIVVKYGEGSKEKFTVSNAGDFSVSSQHSFTLTNEKKLIKLLSDDLAEEIINELKQRLNDI